VGAFKAEENCLAQHMKQPNFRASENREAKASVPKF
jgi:hypothetical protein